MRIHLRHAIYLTLLLFLTKSAFAVVVNQPVNVTILSTNCDMGTGNIGNRNFQFDSVAHTIKFDLLGGFTQTNVSAIQILGLPDIFDNARYTFNISSELISTSNTARTHDIGQFTPFNLLYQLKGISRLHTSIMNGSLETIIDCSISYTAKLTRPFIAQHTDYQETASFISLVKTKIRNYQKTNNKELDTSKSLYVKRSRSVSTGVRG